MPNKTVQTIVDELRNAGYSDSAIRGILANVRDESNFNPNLRHADQPKFSGEAHYAHGLYQKGGNEWNNYAAWLQKNGHGNNWQDPALQTRFLAERLRTGYPDAYAAMNSGTPEQAAQTFVNSYLRPKAEYARGRSERYAQGVPEIDAYANGNVAMPTQQTTGGAQMQQQADPFQAALDEFNSHYTDMRSRYQPQDAMATPQAAQPQPTQAAMQPKQPSMASPDAARQELLAHIASGGNRSAVTGEGPMQSYLRMMMGGRDQSNALALLSHSYPQGGFLR